MTLSNYCTQEIYYSETGVIQVKQERHLHTRQVRGVRWIRTVRYVREVECVKGRVDKWGRVG